MATANYDPVAVEYEKMRPEYPKELVTKFIDVTGINQASHLLEIGAGTGKATMPLASLQFSIDCIEKEAKMAEILIGKISDYPKISVIIDNFETWQGSVQHYDLVFSAQAFHWIDEAIKYKKCHQLLKEKGKLALFWYISIIEGDEMFAELNNVFSKYNTGFACAGTIDFQRFFDREKSRLENTEYFTNVLEYIYNGETSFQSAEIFLERYQTTSSYASLDDETKMKVNDEIKTTIANLGGTVISKLIYGLYVVDKV